ncbi:MAG: DNA translocase FtsK 4TM domain-containing protein [Fimbriimonadaceae bacterium]|nr:DNA translocase FtsK [Fimbriimonadaceae bacterium]NUM37615.1 DNA translocase FtsK 4TM domain-containing protein [Armatimonadota bacterium]WKZ81565.1 MAG: DNA translocase FtsK 4TM domain-containing protein [Fimbriimonadaceae bacterium]
MKTAPRSRAPRARAASAANETRSHRSADMLGVALLALAAITGIALYSSNSGLIGGALQSFFRPMFGVGSWGLVAVFGLWGLGLLAGRKRAESLQLSWGLVLMYAVILGALARPYGTNVFDPDAMVASGGYLGASVSWAMERLLGDAKLVGLGALGTVGLILCLQMPLRAVYDAFAQRAARLKVGRSQPKRVSPPPAKAVVMAEDASAPDPTPKQRTAPILRDANQPELALETEPTKEGYKLPPLALLQPPQPRRKRTPEEMQENIETLEGTLEQFGIEANVVEVATGPTVTRYEIQLGPGIRVNRITSLADNIAMNLAASHVRVEAPIPGKAAIGVEVPNANPATVSLKEVVETKEFREHPSRLAVALGQDVSGGNRYTDLAKMPHLLVGGATNSGKSIGLASLIMSLILRNTPKDVRLVMIDPKRVELALFDGIPHLMCPVIKDVKEAPGVLRAVWREMDRRYDKFSEAGVRNIDGWNEKATFQDKMPYIVVVIDELADLMIQAAAEVETSICRLAQLARATGIHLVVATQRPSVDVITGTIKANIASRVAFTVSSQVDSRTILDQAGAERLIGRGDMLFLPIDASKPLRIQGCYVSEKEIAEVCRFWREQESPRFQIDPKAVQHEESGKPHGEHAGDSDPLWEESVRWVVERGQASTSMLQRRFSIGFQRASRLLDMMEEQGIVGARDGPRPREVLVSLHELEARLGQSGGPFFEAD